MSAFMDRMKTMGRRPAKGDANPILTGKVTPTLLGLSIPMIMAMFLVTGFGLVDMIYLGRFSKEAMAAISLAFPITYLLQTIGGALSTAATSTCSRLIGAGDPRRVRNLVWHVLLVSTGLSIALVPLGIFLLKPALSATEASPVVASLARQYGVIFFAGGIFSMVAMSVNAMFRGEGDTIFPFKIMALGLGLNIILDPLFIFGLGPLPRLGVKGAAVTTVVSFAVAAVVALLELRNRDRTVHFDRTAWRFDSSLLRDMGSVGGPAVVANLALPVSVYLINHMIAPFGTAALAAYGAGLRLLSFVFLPTLGISLSMMIMVGQNHGAGERQRVRKITLSTLGFCLTLLAVLALPVIIWPRWALGLFTDDPEVIAVGAPLARWATLARPMLSVVNITAFWFQARGQGLAGMIPNTLMRVILEPLGVWFGLGLGIGASGLLGGWYGMAVGDALGGLICLIILLWRLRVYVRSAPEPTFRPA